MPAYTITFKSLEKVALHIVNALHSYTNSNFSSYKTYFFYSVQQKEASDWNFHRLFCKFPRTSIIL